METRLKIKIVGNYIHPQGESIDCKVCGNADFGDVVIEDICGRCLLRHRDTTIGLYAMEEKCKNCPSYHVGWKDEENLICCTYYRDNEITGDIFEISENFKCPKEMKQRREYA